LVDYNPYQRPSTLSTSSSGYTDFSTPKTTEKVQKLSLALKESEAYSSRYKSALAKIAKSAEMHTALVHTLQFELDSTSAIAAARRARYNATRARAHATGIVNASELRSMKYKASNWTEAEDISKRKRKWAKVNI
jgi:septal ring factor EnvC (AmiA/AmiB activator)